MIYMNWRDRQFNKILVNGFLKNDEAMDLIAGLTSCQNPDHIHRQGVNWNMVKLSDERKIKPELDREMREERIPLRIEIANEAIMNGAMDNLVIIPNQNSKLGPKWGYIAFESAWECSGDRHGKCQCSNICYAKWMEVTYKDKTIFQIKQFIWWVTHTNEERAQVIADWIMGRITFKGNLGKKDERKGIRFCDTGDVPDQTTLNELFETVRIAADILRDNGYDPDGMFYMYSARNDLDWSNKPWELILNASNDELFNKVPDANRFHAVKSLEDVPEGNYICSCNCKACDYCSRLRNMVIYELRR